MPPSTSAIAAADRVSLAPAATAGEWDQVCARFPDATVFHSYAFLQAVASPLRCRFVPLLVSAGDGPVGAAPLLLKRLGPVSTVNWVPFPYLGPLVPEPLIPATLLALRREAGRRRAVNHQQSFSRVITACGHGGFTAGAERTFIVPLGGRPDGELLAGMHHDLRWQIRRAARTGFEVGPAHAGDMQLMDAWLSEMFASRGIGSGYAAGTVQRVFGALGHQPGSLFHAARLAGRTVAVQATLTDARRAFGWHIAVDPAYRQARPQQLLAWRALQWARDRGVTELDMVGAPNEGIATYKRKFGGRERAYTVLRRQAVPHRVAQSVLARLGPRQPVSPEPRP